MAALAIDRTQGTRVQVAPGGFSEFITVLAFAIHLLTQFTQAIRWTMLAPDLTLQLELSLGPLELTLQTFHEPFPIHNAGHVRRIGFRSLGVGGLASIRCRDVLSISEHEVQFSSFQLIALQFLRTQSLYFCNLSLGRFILSLLQLDNASLFFNLLLQLLDQAVGAKLNLGSHLITLGDGSLGNLAGLERLIVNTSRLSIGMQSI
jgi:hypothetical protein